MRFSLLLGALFLASTAQAASFTFNQDSGSVGFEIIKFKIGSKVAGSFKKFEGTAELDEKKNELQKVSTTIDVASINTADEKRDGHLKSPDFFDVEKHPKMTFVSSAAAAIKPEFDLKGKLTIKGVTKDVVIKMKRSETKENAWVFLGTTTINRLDYGVTWNKALEESDWKSVLGKLGKAVLDDNVDINFNIKLVPVPAKK